MKVVLFCGGMGLRLREYSDNTPKPMVPIGYRPIIWHLMKYYAHYGHKDFILCLGYKADAFKHYFLNYDECISNDFVLKQGGRKVELIHSDIDSWTITFVDTGMHANIGQRLMAVKDYLKDEKEFLANYSDNLSDVPLPQVIDKFHEQDSVASFVSVRPSQTFHVVQSSDQTAVDSIVPVTDCDIWINGGFFCLKQEIFDYMHPGDELVLQPFQRLIQQHRLSTYRHEGFWACMDTFKERQVLEDLHQHGNPPWQVWDRDPSSHAAGNRVASQTNFLWPRAVQP